jgi:hypothetical protein
MNASQARDAIEALLPVPPHHPPAAPPVQIPKPTQRQSDPRYAEQPVQNLGGNLNPDLVGGVLIVAGQVAHGWGGIAD